jgi:hypothetical protein
MHNFKSINNSSLDGVESLLQQILQLYKQMGPQSIESLTKSYLASGPTSESAKDETKVMMAQAFKIFDAEADALLRVFTVGQGFDLSESKNYKRRLEEGYFRWSVAIG